MREENRTDSVFLLLFKAQELFLRFFTPVMIHYCIHLIVCSFFIPPTISVAACSTLTIMTLPTRPQHEQYLFLQKFLC